MGGTAGEVRTKSLVIFFNGPLHMEAPVEARVEADQEFTHISSLQTLHLVKGTYWQRWMMERVREREIYIYRERESGKSMLSA